MTSRCRTFFKTIAAVSLLFFFALSLLQVSTIKCCKKGQVCPLNGTYSDFDGDGQSTFFDCFGKKQGKEKKPHEDFAKKIKKVSILIAKSPSPEHNYASQALFTHTLEIYEDPVFDGPDEPG